jgi:hypothetical protein
VACLYVCTTVCTIQPLGHASRVSRRVPLPYIATVPFHHHTASSTQAISRLHSTLTSLLLATIVIKRWDRSRPSCLGMIRVYPEPPAISSSESSLLEEQTPGRRPSCNACVTPQRVQRFTGVINRDTARGYVLVPGGTLNLIIYSD